MKFRIIALLIFLAVVTTLILLNPPEQTQEPPAQGPAAPITNHPDSQFNLR